MSKRGSKFKHQFISAQMNEVNEKVDKAKNYVTVIPGSDLKTLSEELSKDHE